MRPLGVVGIGIVVMALVSGGWTHAAEPGGAPQVRTGSLAVPGGSLYYEVAGTGDAVVLVHDGLVHNVIWDNQLAAFARDFTVVRYDRRGYGKSPDATAPYANEDDLDALLTHLGIASASLVGMSAGGGMVVDYCLAHPERVDALVLVGAVVSGLGYTDHFASRGGRVDDALRADPARLVRYFLEEDPYEMAPTSTAARARLRQLMAGAPLFMGSAGGRLRRPPARPALPNLGEIHVPTLVVIGERDIPDVHAHGGALEAGIRGARRKVVAGAGHLVPFEQPEAFDAAVIPFLLGRRVNAALAADDAPAATASYAELRKAHPELVPFAEQALNQQGYRLLGAGRIDDAIALFRLNAEAYPGSWNVHDSLGEALATRGDTAGAIAAYQRSMKLNPGNRNGATQLEALRARAAASPAAATPSAAPASELPREHPYLGQKPPGTTPELFAPGILSTGIVEWTPTFSPDGSELVSCVFDDATGLCKLVHMTWADRGWSAPELVPFSSAVNDADPCFSPDGTILLFWSSRPPQPGGAALDHADLWSVARVPGGWGTPRHLGAAVNSPSWEVAPSVAANGNLVFTSYRKDGLGGADLWMSRLVDGAYQPPVNLGDAVNSPANDSEAFVAPNESYLVFTSTRPRPDGRTDMDLYVSFRLPDGAWARAVNLGPDVNTPATEQVPIVSPDGAYLFFSSERRRPLDYTTNHVTLADIRAAMAAPGNGRSDVYWVDASVITRLKPTR